MKKIIPLLLFITIIHISLYSQVIKNIPITNERNKTVIPVSIDGVELKILLDTGMSFDGLMVYNTELSKSFNLRNPINVRVPGAGSGPPSEGIMDTSSSFTIGDQVFKDQKILFLTSDTFAGFPTDGIMGYTIFGNYAVEIDYDDGYLSLHDYDSLKIDDTWYGIPIYFKNNTIPWMDVKLKIADEELILISTYIDFAAGETIALLEKPGQIFETPEDVEPTHLGTGLSGEIYGSKGEISELIIGKYSLKNIIAAFTSADVRSKQPNADGIIGNGSLQYFNLIFDYKNRYLYIKPNSKYYLRFSENPIE
jgi:hypothetical protein